MINETFARRVVGVANPAQAVGNTFRINAQVGPIEVIGVVEDGKYVSLDEEPKPVLFPPSMGAYQALTTIAVRIHTAGPRSPGAVAERCAEHGSTRSASARGQAGRCARFCVPSSVDCRNGADGVRRARDRDRGAGYQASLAHMVAGSGTVILAYGWRWCMPGSGHRWRPEHARSRHAVRGGAWWQALSRVSRPGACSPPSSPT